MRCPRVTTLHSCMNCSPGWVKMEGEGGGSFGARAKGGTKRGEFDWLTESEGVAGVDKAVIIQKIIPELGSRLG